MSTPGVASVYAKLAIAAKAVAAVPKEYNANLKYSVQPWSAVLEVVRKAVLDAGLIVTFSEVECGEASRWLKLDRAAETSSGPMFMAPLPPLTTVLLRATIACVDTGATVEILTRGQAMDTGDKGLKKARTSAIKGFYLEHLMIRDSEETDTESMGAFEDDPSQRPRHSGKAEKRPEPESLGSLCAQAPGAVTDMCKRHGITQVAPCREWIKANAADWPLLDLEKAVLQFAATLTKEKKSS